MLIKEREGFTDRQTVEAIQENPYLQFFIGLEEFTQDRPFDASLMVDFRKRFGEEGMQRIAEAIALASLSPAEDPPGSDDQGEDDPSPPNRGKLIADATCAPADIRYPTDVSLLNEDREKTDTLIDRLHQPLKGKQPRPRTYRVKARRQFVAFIKQKSPRKNKVRQANRQQLGHLKRNLQAIDRLLETPESLPLSQLSCQEYQNLLVCRELYRQQQQMYDHKTQRVDDRIVIDGRAVNAPLGEVLRPWSGLPLVALGAFTMRRAIVFISHMSVRSRGVKRGVIPSLGRSSRSAWSMVFRLSVGSVGITLTSPKISSDRSRPTGVVSASIPRVHTSTRSIARAPIGLTARSTVSASVDHRWAENRSRFPKQRRSKRKPMKRFAIRSKGSSAKANADSVWDE